MLNGFDYSQYHIENKLLIVENPDSVDWYLFCIILPDSVKSPDNDIFIVEPEEFSYFCTR